MERFFILLLRLTLLGSLLAVLLLLLRPLLRGKVSQTAFYYLWLPVLLRLCLPVGITVFLPAPIAAAARAVPIIPGGGASLSPATGALGWSVFAALWGLGAAVCLGRYIWSYLRLFRRIRQSSLPPSALALSVLRGLDPAGRVGLAQCPLIATPMLVGAVRPLIVLPVGIEGREQLEDILAHELTHARRHDLLYKWFVAGATSLHWFNPLMILARREINCVCELSCDEAVVRGLDDERRRRYAQTLLDLAAWVPSGLGPLSAALCREKAQLKERLISIANYRETGKAAAGLALLLVLAVGGCALICGAEPVPAGPISSDTPISEDRQSGLAAFRLAGGHNGLAVFRLEGDHIPEGALAMADPDFFQTEDTITCLINKNSVKFLVEFVLKE